MSLDALNLIYRIVTYLERYFEVHRRLFEIIEIYLTTEMHTPKRDDLRE